MAFGVTDKRWTLEDIVEMTNAYGMFRIQSPSQRTYKPTPKDQIPLPWYLDLNSDGPPEKGLAD